MEEEKIEENEQPETAEDNIEEIPEEGGTSRKNAILEKAKGEMSAFAKSMLFRLFKLNPPVFIGVGALILIFFVILLLGAVKLSLDFLDSDENSNGLSYNSVGDSSSYWWPIGSSETTTVDGKLFASSTPTLTSISSVFSKSRTIQGRTRPHYGIDISGEGRIGVDYVIASKEGTVYKMNDSCPSNGSYGNKCGGELGNYVMLKHPDGSYTKYGHMAANSVTVKTGESVKQGQVIGKVGSSGSSTGSHLHFQIEIGGYGSNYAVDPTTYVSSSNARPVAKKNSYVSGDSNMQTVCLTLKNAGFSDNAVAGIMGNMYNESSFKPTATNYLDCRGIVQWCFGRKNELVNTYGSNWSSIDNQLQFFVSELNGTYYNRVTYYLKENHSAEDMAYKFCMKFEVPGANVCASGKRQSQARSYVSYVQNGCN